MRLFIPTEFSNLDIDGKGFVYATNIDVGSKEPIKRLNPSGEDVLKRFGYFPVAGDIYYRRTVGPSKFVDIKVLGDGFTARSTLPRDAYSPMMSPKPAVCLRRHRESAGRV